MKKKSLVVKKTIHKLLLKNLKNNRVSKAFNIFENHLNNSINKKNKIAVSISGGPDSLALAFLTKCYLLKNNLKSEFFLVDHGLRKESSNEAKTVKLMLKKFDINITILKWVGKKPNSNIQNIARNKRYKLIKNACQKKNIKNLLVGHHIDDLYENFFIRLLRGSGLKGLSSFGETIKDKDNFLIVRPLIKFKKKELIYISKIVFNFFVKDPSNENFIFSRIRIRKLISELKKEGLDIHKLNLTIKNLKIANNTINFYVQKNLQSNAKFIRSKNTYLLNENFLNQSDEINFRSISSVLKEISGRYYPPRGKSIYQSLLKMKLPKYKKFTLGGCFVEKINKTVFVTKEN